MTEQVSIFEKPFAVLKGCKAGDIIDADLCPQHRFEILVLGDQRYAMGHYQGLGYLKLIPGTNSYYVVSIPFSNR